MARFRTRDPASAKRELYRYTTASSTTSEGDFNILIECVLRKAKYMMKLLEITNQNWGNSVKFFYI